MTWEETIEFIRHQPEFEDLVEKAYLDKNLQLNVERFMRSEEFEETLHVLREYASKAKSILDVGGGNGISTVAFALSGYDVTVAEPDISETVGAGAIRRLLKAYNIEHVKVYEEYAEKIKTGNLFDIIYVRQAMHHANDLKQFIKNLSTLLKPGGFLLTVRDHVIYNEADKKWFLDCHPLQKFYGGENAFTSEEYQAAMLHANLKIIKVWKHFDSVINYFPLTRQDVLSIPVRKEKEIKQKLVQKIGMLGHVPLVQKLYKKKIGFKAENLFNEKQVAGRLYSYLAQKE